MALLGKSDPSASKPGVSNSGENEPSELDLDIANAFVQMGTRDGDAPVKGGLAKETLVSLLYQHSELLAKQGQKKQSATLFEFAMHLSETKLEDAKTEQGFADLERQARYLMTNGRFALAATMLESLAAAAPNHLEVHLNLASIFHALKRQDDARNLLVNFFAQYPTEFIPAEDSTVKKGTLLVVSGFDKTYYKMGTRDNGTFRRYRRGGHFMLKYLINTDPYDQFAYTVSSDNINRSAPDLQYGLLLNTIADADTEHNSLKSLEVYANEHPKTPIVNHPSNVLKTTRDENYQRLNKLPGIRFPKTERFLVGNKSVPTILEEIETAEFAFPLIIRETGTHTAVSTLLVSEKGELEAYLTDVSGDSVYVIEFIENASTEGHYTKMRFFAIDGQLYPVVRHVDKVWNVHGGNRKVFMNDHEWMIEKEKQFLSDPASVIGKDTFALLQKLPDFVGLEFFGFDFTILDDDTVLIFELNPAMRHSFSHAKNSPYMQPHLQKISDAFQEMIDRKIVST